MASNPSSSESPTLSLHQDLVVTMDSPRLRKNADPSETCAEHWIIRTAGWGPQPRRQCPDWCRRCMIDSHRHEGPRLGPLALRRALLSLDISEFNDSLDDL